MGAEKLRPKQEAEARKGGVRMFLGLREPEERSNPKYHGSREKSPAKQDTELEF